MTSKIDAMRAERERQWAERQKRAREAPMRDDDTAIGTLHNEPSTPALQPEKKPATRAPASGAKGRSAARASTAAKSSSSAAGKRPPFVPPPPRVPADDEGTCAGCGKIRAVRNGKIAHHQKGLGKPCPGAGKVPA